MRQGNFWGKVGFNGFSDIPFEGASKNTILGENVQTKHLIASLLEILYKKGELLIYN